MEGRIVKTLQRLVFVLSVSLFLSLAAAQGARHHAAVAELRRLERVQAEWVEENRRLLASLAVARSRSRIGEAMKDAEGYRLVSPGTTLRIRVEPGLEKRDG